MKFGVMIFPTEYAIRPDELGVAAEERGFESLWSAEHSHIPASRETPWPGGRGSSADVLRRDGSLCLAVGRGAGDDHAQDRNWHLPSDPARSDSDREVRREPRPTLEWPFSFWRRWRLERRRDEQSRHRVERPLEASARTDRSDEGDLDAGPGGISWRPGRLRPDRGEPEADAEAASPRFMSVAPIREGCAARFATATDGCRSWVGTKICTAN